MKIVLPKGRPPQATAEQIIEAYKECRNISKVCRDLHVGSDRVNRTLDEAGFERTKRPNNGSQRHRRTKKSIPKNYIEAISAYQNGASMAEIEKKYDVNVTQLYRWMTTMGVRRRDPPTYPVRTEWNCWECGKQAPYGELFCSDKHRRDYGRAAIRPGFKPPVHYRQEANESCQSTR